MADIQEIQFLDEDGQTYSLYVETKVQLPASANPQRSLRDGNTNRETYDPLAPTATKLADIRQAIRLYAQYAIAGFRDLGSSVEVEEIKLKFGLKIGGKGGIPILAEASTEGNFEIEVKCKFPPKKGSQPNP